MLLNCNLDLPEGFLVEPLETGHGLVDGVLGKLAHRDDAMSALNSAFLNTGIAIRVSRNCVVDKPLHIEWSSSGEQTDMAMHPRVVIFLEENAELNLVEHYTPLKKFKTPAIILLLSFAENSFNCSGKRILSLLSSLRV